MEFLKQAKEEIQAKVREETSITLEKPDPSGHGGTSTTGNVASSMLNTNNRLLLTHGINNLELKSKLDRIIVNMAVILAVINSNKKVNVPVFSEFCRNTSLLVKSVSWIHIIPSAHVVLAHSPELIDGNNEMGLLNFTECGLEANNKFLRQYRINYSRKTSQFDNLSDCLNRLWDKSDPMVKKTCERLHCSHCNTQGHTVRSCLELKKTLSGCNTEFEDLILLLHNSLS